MRRRLDYEAALGVIDLSGSKNRGDYQFKPNQRAPSVYSESGDSEHSDDYTLEEDDDGYTDGSSYTDGSEDESYERALTVFSRGGYNHQSG